MVWGQRMQSACVISTAAAAATTPGKKSNGIMSFGVSQSWQLNDLRTTITNYRKQRRVLSLCLAVHIIIVRRSLYFDFYLIKSHVTCIDPRLAIGIHKHIGQDKWNRSNRYFGWKVHFGCQVINSLNNLFIFRVSVSDTCSRCWQRHTNTHKLAHTLATPLI